MFSALSSDGPWEKTMITTSTITSHHSKPFRSVETYRLKDFNLLFPGWIGGFFYPAFDADVFASCSWERRSGRCLTGILKAVCFLGRGGTNVRRCWRTRSVLPGCHGWRKDWRSRSDQLVLLGGAVGTDVVFAISLHQAAAGLCDAHTVSVEPLLTAIAANHKSSLERNVTNV